VLFAEGWARPLLIAHAVVGAATIAVTTHLVVWARRFPRGDYRRLSGVRWLAVVGLGLYLVQFGLGNLLYPVYKVRVRAEHFDLPSSVRGEAQARFDARHTVDELRKAEAARTGRDPGLVGPPVRAPRDLSSLGRLFDVKEHWAALGLPLVAAAFAIAFAWRPAHDGPWGGRALLWFAVGAALCAWIPGLIGLWVTSFRAVGGLA
jgi:hypothetical protein